MVANRPNTNRHPVAAMRQAADRMLTADATTSSLLQAPLEPASFDLVSAQYPAWLRTPDAAAERALLSAVAPDGLLLLVHHAGMDTEQASESGPTHALSV
jgi:hypothetical protein